MAASGERISCSLTTRYPAASCIIGPTSLGDGGREVDFVVGADGGLQAGVGALVVHEPRRAAPQFPALRNPALEPDLALFDLGRACRHAYEERPDGAVAGHLYLV